MDKVLLVPDVMARYNCSAPTARKRMREMFHTEKPLMVLERSLRAWECEKMIGPIDSMGKKRNDQRAVKTRKKKPAKMARISYRD